MRRTTFLHEVAQYYLDHFQDKEICIVFPNQRAATFFKNALLELNPVHQWLPDLLSSQDLIKSLSSLQIIDSVRALFELYEVYRESEGTDGDSFDLFSTWAPQLLHDFQEIDLYCVNAKDLYQSVDAAYAIKNWSPNRSEITHHQEQYIRFWAKMGKWYHAYTSRLLSKKTATSAMAYRSVAEQIHNLSIPYDHIVFAGFNALNSSEKKIIKYLEKNNKASLLWDLDEYYLNQDLHEAGHFARTYKKETGKSSLNYTGNYLKTIKRKIHIHGVAKNIGQTLVAGNILNDYANDKSEISQTALVLSDETLLMPMLEVMPENISTANITMGYPLHRLSVSALYSVYLEMHLRARSVQPSKQIASAFYYKDLLRLFRNQIFAALLPPRELKLILQKIETCYETFIEPSIFMHESYELNKYSFLFNNLDDSANKALEGLQKLTESIKNHENYKDKKNEGYELESLFEISTLINKIKLLLNEYEDIANLKTLVRVYQQFIRQLSLPFLGEPLSGLQIMGLLETRNLDFKNLIVLSVNENIIPAAKTQNSFIPFDISRHFGLPTYRERDAIFAYHFYRMIQRAENVHLIYNTESDEFGKGEKSRFITQIEQELNTENTEIHSSLFIPKPPKREIEEIEVKKNNTLINDLLKRYDGNEVKHSLSPTALSTFFRCKLQYYFKYFSKIKIEDSKEEEIGANELGDISHKVLEKLFEPRLNRILTKTDYIEMIKQVDTVLNEQLKQENSGRNYNEGKAILAKHGLSKMIHQQLTSELNQLDGNEIIILSLEKNISTPIEVKTEYGPKKIYFGGKADRVELRNNVLNIIDYKSGRVESSQIKLDNIGDIFEKEDADKAIQLLQYLLLAMNEFPQYDFYTAGIMSLRVSSKGQMLLNIDSNTVFSKNYKEQIERLFSRTVELLLNKENTFSQTHNSKACEYCDYKSLCSR